MTIKRGALQDITICHLVILPFPVQFLKGQMLVSPECIDDPDVLVEYLSRFHSLTIKLINE
jgi:hypothetical protein